jgi:hypothetical protein
MRHCGAAATMRAEPQSCRTGVRTTNRPVKAPSGEQLPCVPMQQLTAARQTPRACELFALVRALHC